MGITVDFKEHDQQRLRRRLRNLGGGTFSRDELDQLVAGDLSVLADKPRRVKRAVAPLVRDEAPAVRGALEQMVGESLDLVPASYLSRARAAADAVCRVVSDDRKAKGTGVLVAPGLLLTNHHVIGGVEEASEMLAQFAYELDANNEPVPSTEFALAPSTFFWTSPVGELDATLIAIGEPRSGETSKSIDAFGLCAMSDADDKHATGDHVTVVQHPGGDYKQVALRDNRVLGRGEGGITLHYASDTLPGSSGSPVFNDEFALVALHHAGGTRLETKFDTGAEIPAQSNEGIRISCIVNKLRVEASALGEAQAAIVARILS